MPKRKASKQVAPPPPVDHDQFDEEQKGETSQMTAEQAEEVAQFFEDNPIFYDLSHKDYKDRVKRATLLKEIGAKIGIDPDRIWTKFTNMRTDFFKLKKRLKGKSGDGLIRMALQKYKLERYAFLSVHYKGGDEQISSSCLGSVGVTEDDHDETDIASMSSEQSSNAVPAVSTEADPPLVKKAKRNEGKKDVSEVLRQFLAESRREIQESRASIAEVSASGNGTNERDAWANWLGSLQRDIPKEHWRQYQKETFDVAMKYLTPQQKPHAQQPLMQHQPHVMPFQHVLQPPMTFQPQQQRYPVMFQATPPQTTQPFQTQSSQAPPRLQSNPVTTAWETSPTTSSGLLGLAMTALNTPSSSYNLGDITVDQQNIDVTNTDEREADGQKESDRAASPNQY